MRRRPLCEKVCLVFGLLLLLFQAAPGQNSADIPPLKNPRSYTGHLIGHAHIDLAWLWRWEETVHDIAPQTFLGTLARMKKMPGLTFAQSQPAVYEAIEKAYPALFNEIRKAVHDGTWIPVGGMWAEPDLNMPDGESLARQFLYGKRYFLEKFGVDVRVGWNPDSFGHNGQLPQILDKAGIKFYVFERCAPEKKPIFWWEGKNGSKILSYVPPGWYLVNLKQGLNDIFKDIAVQTPLKDFLVLYGEGDHGGGPRNSDIESIKKFKADKNHPKLEFSDPEEYFKKIAVSGVTFPVVNNELNFTFPACYTTQAATKKFNRLAENLLLSTEKFSAFAVASGRRDYYPERDLDEAWKIVLRNQFHDILDGSSIGPVYDEARGYYKDALERGKRALEFSLECLTNGIDTRGEGIPVVVYNPLFWERTEPVTAVVSVPSKDSLRSIKVLDNAGKEIPVQITGSLEQDGLTRLTFIFIASKVPSFGYKLFRAIPCDKPTEFPSSLSIFPFSLENEFFKVLLDEKTGWITSIADKKEGREVLSGPANVLQAIVDEPASMSAWELGLKDTFWNIGDGARIEVTEQGPVRSKLQVRTSFRSSVFEQDIILYAGVPRIDCFLSFDWQERNLMIKAAFPVAVKNAGAECEIPFGSITRPADGQEVPALKWVDVSDGSGQYGVSLLNDCKYGFDIKGNVMRLSVIHGATSPDPEADRGRHEVLYSLYPHSRTWKEAHTTRRGMELNNPLIPVVAMDHKGEWPSERSFIRVSPENVVLSAMKKEMGYYGRNLVLRLYETHGRATEAVVEFPWAVAFEETDLIERPMAIKRSGTNPQPKAGSVSVALAPFEIKTIKVVRLPEN